MLVELAINNLAIIEALRLQFPPGFAVLTGETGAGKSIIIDAVALLLGERASNEMIRTGSDEASVEGVFALPVPPPAALADLLQELGLSPEGDELILRREISRGRRATCRVNGHAVTLAALQEIGSHLIDIHGQGDHLSLLNVRHHVDFLDRYGGLLAQRQALAERVAELRRVRAEMARLQRDARELARRVDLLSYQIEEIKTARLRPDEEDELRRQRTLLANAEKRMQLASELYALLAHGEEGQRSLTDLLGAIAADLAHLAQFDETLKEESERTEGVLYQMEDLARTIRGYRDEIEFDPRGLEKVEERLELIASLKRKYGDSIAEVLAFATSAQEELEGISHGEERLEALRDQEAALLQALAGQAAELSAARTQAAARLRTAVERELGELSMERAQFLIQIAQAPDPEGLELGQGRWRFDATGVDQVEFLIAPNPGEEPKPLAKTASGGETSRLMLAMKTALAAIDPVPTLIFDEIDAGIGGRTGTIVGQKLWRLARTHQVFCVTHLAQIAAYGSQHFRVAKEVVDGRTLSDARPLARAERVEELAVLLSGAATETARRNAEELLRCTAEQTTPVER
ncbi:MAG: DNA repair protein RecN [Chloroflexota bacterium]